MDNHNELGRLGEQIAKKHLENQEYSILDCNWRWGKGEIDLIATIGKTLVFIEVKTRKTANFGDPEEAVSTKKQNLLYEVATEYMYRIQHEGEFRFDIIAITIEPQLDIQHFEDAFFPHW